MKSVFRNETYMRSPLDVSKNKQAMYAKLAIASVIGLFVTGHVQSDKEEIDAVLTVNCDKRPRAIETLQFPITDFQQHVLLQVNGQVSSIIVRREEGKTFVPGQIESLSSEDIGKVLIRLNNGAELIAGRPGGLRGEEEVLGWDGISLACEEAIR